MRIGKFEIRRIRKNTVLHPEYKKLAKFAFEMGGEAYYQYENLLDLPPKRWHKVEEFIREAELRLEREDLNSLVDAALHSINKPHVKMTEVVLCLQSIKEASNMFLEIETFYKLFSAVFFTMDEDITVYDYEYNQEKIAKFKQEDTAAFFLREPMRKLLPLSDISDGDIEVFIAQSKAQKELIQKISKNFIEGQPA